MLSSSALRSLRAVLPMEEYEWQLLLVFTVVISLKLLQQLALLLAPVRVPVLSGGGAGDAVSAARDEAEWALYAKEGKPPGFKRLGLTLSLLAAVAACVPVWWRLTEARVAHALQLRIHSHVRRYTGRRCRWLRCPLLRSLRRCTSPFACTCCAWATLATRMRWPSVRLLR